MACIRTVFTRKHLTLDKHAHTHIQYLRLEYDNLLPGNPLGGSRVVGGRRHLRERTRVRRCAHCRASATFSCFLSSSAYTRQQHLAAADLMHDKSCCYIPRQRRGRRRAQKRPEALASGGVAARRMSAQSRPLRAACCASCRAPGPVKTLTAPCV